MANRTVAFQINIELIEEPFKLLTASCEFIDVGVCRTGTKWELISVPQIVRLCHLTVVLPAFRAALDQN